MQGYIEKMLKGYKNKGRISFAMPGHKNCSGMKRYLKLPDVTELPDTDSLHTPHAAIESAMRGISGLLGTDKSYILVNGSTCGIFAMLASSCKRGDKVLLSRVCHMSAINACMVMGLLPIFFEHKIYSEYSMHGEADIDDLIKKLEVNDIRAVLVTSPTYFGAVSDIKRISGLLKKRKIPLLVDEAHGAHFISGDFLPQSAITLGADMSVISTHKTLRGFNQTAVLNLKSEIISADRVGESVGIFETSSPSYPLAASAEGAILDCLKNQEKWKKLSESCNELKEYLRENTRIKIPSCADGFFELDSTRLVLNFSAYDVTGYEICGLLREDYNIDIEMAEAENIVLIPTPYNTLKDFRVLKRALCRICKGLNQSREKEREMHLPELSESIHSPSEAFCARYKYIDIEKSIGKISAKTVTVYPPGVPVLVPGAYITEEMAEYLLASRGEITGAKDGKIAVVKGDEYDG